MKKQFWKRLWKWLKENWDNIILFFWVLLGTPLAFYFAYNFFFFEPEEAGMKLGEDGKKLKEAGTATLIAYIAAIFPVTAGLYLAGKRTKEMGRENEIAEQGNRIESFSRALEQLEHKKELVRLGAVATFRQLGESTKEEDVLKHEAVVRALISFIRKRAGMPVHIDQKTGAATIIIKKMRRRWIERLDIEEAIKTLDFITRNQREKILLSTTDFRNLKLDNVDFSHFDFPHSYFFDAMLDNTKFFNADLSWANFSLAQLNGADFSKANLQSTKFSGANLLLAKGLTTERVSMIRYYKKHPPTLPEGVECPTDDRNIINEEEGKGDCLKSELDILETPKSDSTIYKDEEDYES